MALMKARVDEIFFLLSKILMGEGNEGKDLDIFFQAMYNNLPVLSTELARLANKQEEKTEGIFDWIAEAILYMKGDVDDLPRMDYGGTIIQ